MFYLNKSLDLNKSYILLCVHEKEREREREITVSYFVKNKL